MKLLINKSGARVGELDLSTGKSETSDVTLRVLFHKLCNDGIPTRANADEGDVLGDADGTLPVDDDRAGLLAVELALHGYDVDDSGLRYSPDQPRDDHGRFGEGSSLQEGTAEHLLASLSTGAAVDKLSYADNRAAIDKMAEAYKQGGYIKGAADVVSKYSEIDQPTGLATREIVSQALAGKTLEEIKADPKVQGLIADAQQHLAPGYTRFKEEDLKNLVEGASGYYQAIRNAAPSTESVYRGTASKATIKRDEFELRGPTAFSHSKESAMTYANGTLFEVLPGAHMLPTGTLKAVKNAAEGDPHATAPAFYNRSDSVIHPLGSSHGFRIGFDTDRELTSSGRFRVVSQEKKLVTFTDTVSGKFRTRTVNYVKVEQVGAF